MTQRMKVSWKVVMVRGVRERRIDTRALCMLSSQLSFHNDVTMIDSF